MHVPVPYPGKPEQSGFELEESKEFNWLDLGKDKNGGSAWESNPPGTVLAPHTGFEVRFLRVFMFS